MRSQGQFPGVLRPGNPPLFYRRKRATTSACCEPSQARTAHNPPAFLRSSRSGGRRDRKSKTPLSGRFAGDARVNPPRARPARGPRSELVLQAGVEEGAVHAEGSATTRIDLAVRRAVG